VKNFKKIFARLFSSRRFIIGSSMYNNKNCSLALKFNIPMFPTQHTLLLCYEAKILIIVQDDIIYSA